MSKDHKQHTLSDSNIFSKIYMLSTSIKNFMTKRLKIEPKGPVSTAFRLKETYSQNQIQNTYSIKFLFKHMFIK